MSHLETFLSDLADLRYRQQQYQAAEQLYRELLERGRPDHTNNIVQAAAGLGRLLADWAWVDHVSKPEGRNLEPEAIQRAYEAERLLRESIRARLQRTKATPWRTSEWKSRLGAALVSVAAIDSQLSPGVRETRLAEAEALLVEGNDAVQNDPTSERRCRRDTLERLVRLYTTWSKPTQAAEWRSKLEAWKQADAEVPQ